MLFFLSYRLVHQLFRNSVEVIVNTKAFNSLDFSMFYAEENNQFSDKDSDKLPLIASQFLKDLVFKIPETKKARQVKLSMGKTNNVVTIEKICLCIKKMTHRDTLAVWKGRDIKAIIKEGSGLTFGTDNTHYFQIQTNGTEHASLLFNDVLFREIDKYEKSRSTGQLKTIVTSLLIALFLTVSLFYFTPIQNASVKSFVRNGGVLVVGFTLLIFFIFFNSELVLFEDMENSENRIGNVKPKLSYLNFFDYPDEYTKYAKDRFSYRNLLFYAHSLLKVKIFETSPLPQDIIVGKKGWFFYNEIGSIRDTRGMNMIGQDELVIISMNVRQKQSWLSKRNIRFYIIVPPNKDRVYAEYLPAGYFRTKIGATRVDMYRQHLSNNFGIKLIDPTDSLIAAKQRKDVYYTTDTHWNLFGGFKAYQVLIDDIAKDFTSIKPIKEEDLDFLEHYNNEGDIARMLALHNKYLRKETTPKFKDSSKRLIPPTTSDILIRFTGNKTIDGSTLKVLMFRDSYANYLIPYLNMHFKDAVYVWSYEFMDKLIEEEQPDVVILECLQRFLPQALLTPNPQGVE